MIGWNAGFLEPYKWLKKVVLKRIDEKNWGSGVFRFPIFVRREKWILWMFFKVHIMKN